MKELKIDGLSELPDCVIVNGTRYERAEEERWGYCDGLAYWHWLIRGDKVLFVWPDGTTATPSGYSPDQIRNIPKFFRCDANGKRLQPAKTRGEQ